MLMNGNIEQMYWTVRVNSQVVFAQNKNKMLAEIQKKQLDPNLR
jgi:hypothetical protein